MSTPKKNVPPAAKVAAVIAAAAVSATADSANADAVVSVKPEAKTSKAPATVAGLRVVSRPASFRRAGYEFTGEPTEIALADLTEKQIAQLRGEKSLVVVDCKIAVEAEAAAAVAE